MTFGTVLESEADVRSIPLNYQFLTGREQAPANSALPVDPVWGLAHRACSISVGWMDGSVGDGLVDGCLDIQRDG